MRFDWDSIIRAIAILLQILIPLAVVFAVLYAVYYSIKKRSEKKKQAKKLAEQAKKQAERDNYMMALQTRFKNSQCMADCVEIIKKSLPFPPWDRSVDVDYSHIRDNQGLVDISFYDLGYNYLKDHDERTAFAKALAESLGEGFSYYETPDFYLERRIGVKYKTKPLKNI